MGIQFPPIAFLYLLYFYICIYIFILCIGKTNIKLKLKLIQKDREFTATVSQYLIIYLLFNLVFSPPCKYFALLFHSFITVISIPS